MKAFDIKRFQYINAGLLRFLQEFRAKREEIRLNLSYNNRTADIFIGSLRGETFMIIRSFRLSDHVFVNRLLAEVLSEPCYTETKAALAKQLSWDSELVLVAEDNEEVVGVIIGTIDNNRGYIYRLAVEASHQRKGIGKTLIRSLDHKFRHRDVTRILVAVDEHNQCILPFFDAAGCMERLLSVGRRVLRIVN
jgi:ribosomal protein S18 acetylase RimI-like enzyme